MPSSIWNKYTIIKEIDSNENIKTYLTRFEPIIKEIMPKNKDQYFAIIEYLETLKKHFNIYEIIDENDRIYIVIDKNNDELLSKIDKLVLSDELDIKKEGILYGQRNPITKDEINELFKMEKSMCKISFETNDNKKVKGAGFCCEIGINFPIKYALFNNNHILNESNLEIGQTIQFEYLELQKSYFSFRSSYNTNKKKIEITEKRKIFTNKELD